MAPQTRGTKVSDPQSKIQEGTGPVDSGSLAAESTSSGGGFASNPPPSTTTPASHTSGSTNPFKVLDAASDAVARGDGASETYETPKAGSTVDTAPSYVNNVVGSSGGKPKGKNLTEGGFESYDGKNASFNGDIGGKNDPGLEAEKEFARKNAIRDAL